MTDVHILDIDLAKRSFQICATSPGGAVLFNRTVSQAKLETHLHEQAPCVGCLRCRWLAPWPRALLWPSRRICVPLQAAGTSSRH